MAEAQETSTSDLGVGECSCGDTECGLYEPAYTASTARPTLWSERLGRQGSLPQLDMRSRDTVVDERGRTVGWSSMRHQVLLALTTEKGSSAVSDLGMLMPKGKLTDSVLRQWEQSARDAVAHLVKGRFIELVTVRAQRSATQSASATLTVRFRDVRTGREDEVSLT